MVKSGGKWRLVPSIKTMGGADQMTGEYYHTMDAKGRLIFPVKLKEELGDSFYVTKGLDHCLFVYSPQAWESFEAKIKALPMSKSRDLQRFFFSGACLCTCDGQGRICLPQSLREYAQLEKDLCTIGVSERAEIWNAQRWQQYHAALNEDVERIAGAMEELGF